MTSGPAEPYDGPERPPQPIETFDDPSARWLGEERIEIVTKGSSSCPATIDAVSVEGADRLQLTVGSGRPAAGRTAEGVPIVCTSDLSPTAHTLDLPNGIDARPLIIVLRAEETGEETELVLD